MRQRDNAVIAATPPLAAFKYLLSRVVTFYSGSKKKQKPRKLMLIDFKRAFLHTRHVWHFGSSKAEVGSRMVEHSGATQGVSSVCVCVPCAGRGCRSSATRRRHTEGTGPDLEASANKLRQKLKHSVKAVMGPEETAVDTG
eukprot:5974287-Amphidinium_carterae.2